MIIIYSIIILLISYKLQTGTYATIQYVPEKQSNTVHIFWTGGFDSTFRVLQLLISEHKTVQPIYISADIIDGYFLNGQLVLRKNKQFEINAMNKIRFYLNKKYPFTKQTLLPTKYINNITKDKEYIIAMNNIYFSRFGILAPVLNQQFGYFSRPLNQYGVLSMYTKQYEYPIEVCLENTNTGIVKLTNLYRTGSGHNCKLIQNKPNNLKIFDKFRFPIIHLSKQNMLIIAKKYKYNDILKYSWSCWFPTKNGKPCGKCDMCLHRII